MAIEPPPDVVHILHVMGLHWPDVNEDTFRDLSDTLETVGEEIQTQTSKSNQAIHSLKAAISSDAYDVLSWRWDGSAHPRLNDLANDLLDMHQACRVICDAIVDIKLEILARAGALLAEFTAAQIAAATAAGTGVGVPISALVEAGEQVFIWGVKDVINALIQKVEHHVFEDLIKSRLGGVRHTLDQHINALVTDGLVEVVGS